MIETMRMRLLRITSSIPEMSGVMFSRVAEKIVLINPRTGVVIGVVDR